jgi:hypothetical protein
MGFFSGRRRHSPGACTPPSIRGRVCAGRPTPRGCPPAPPDALWWAVGTEGQPSSPRGRGRQRRPIMMEGQPGTAGSPRGRGRQFGARQRAASKGLLPNWRAASGGASESSIDWRAEAAPRASCPIGGTREEPTLFSARHETSVCRGEPPRNLTPVGERHPCAHPLPLPSRARVRSGPAQGAHIRVVRSASHDGLHGTRPARAARRCCISLAVAAMVAAAADTTVAAPNAAAGSERLRRRLR